jgi:hypothetical protein
MLSLHEAISAVCPIDGVSMGDPKDKSTWRIDYATNATGKQKAAAAAVIAGFDPYAPSRADVSAECASRMRTFTHNGVEYWFDGESQADIAAAGLFAYTAMASKVKAGNLKWLDPQCEFAWPAANGQLIPMDAKSCYEFARAAQAYKCRMQTRAAQLKSMSPIPGNYRDASRWK